MPAIELSDAAQYGIQGVVKSKPQYSEKYLEARREADKRIEEYKMGLAYSWASAKYTVCV